MYFYQPLEGFDYSYFKKLDALQVMGGHNNIGLKHNNWK